MTTQADYTDEEWATLRRAPLVAGLAISLADPGGPFELTKETLATLKAARTPPSQDELLLAVSKDLDEQVRTQANPLDDLGLRGRTAAAGRRGAGQGQRDPGREGDARGGGELPAVARPGGPGRRRGGQGGRALRHRRGAGEQEREEAMLDKIREILGVPEG